MTVNGEENWMIKSPGSFYERVRPDSRHGDVSRCRVIPVVMEVQSAGLFPRDVREEVIWRREEEMSLGAQSSSCQPLTQRASPSSGAFFLKDELLF